MFLPLGGKVRMRGKSGHEQQFPSPHPSPSRGEGEKYLTPLLTSPSERNEVPYYLKSRHTELSEVSQTDLVRINPSPQSSPQGEEEKVLISHTARSFTKLNFCVCIGWSSDYYCALRGLSPKISCVLYNIICNEAKCI